MLRAGHAAADTTPSARDRRFAVGRVALFAATWAVLEAVLVSRLRQPYDVTEIVWARYSTHLAIVGLLWGRQHPGHTLS